MEVSRGLIEMALKRLSGGSSLIVTKIGHHISKYASHQHNIFFFKGIYKSETERLVWYQEVILRYP